MVKQILIWMGLILAIVLIVMVVFFGFVILVGRGVGLGS